MRYEECEDCQHSCPDGQISICEEEDREERLEREQEIMASCCCGAFQWVDKKGFVQVADCCCGRT
jgi:hypothetical protein